MSSIIYNGYVLDTIGATTFIFTSGNGKQQMYVGDANSLANAQALVDGGTLPSHILTNAELLALYSNYIIDEI